MIRRASSRWRVLVHDMLPGGRSGDAYHLQSEQIPAPEIATGQTVEVLPGTDLDEVVVGRWLHLEQMDTGVWWMVIGGVTVHVRADREGRPTNVIVTGPGLGEQDPFPGCSYELAGWVE